MRNREKKPPSDVAIPKEIGVLRAQTKRLLRQIFAIFGGILLVLLSAVGLFFLVDALVREPEPTFRFYPVKEENILENEAYLQMDREIYFEDQNGITERLDAEYLKNNPNRQLQFMYELIHTVIAGDENAYNRMFNSVYYKDHEKQAAFTPQMLRNLRLSVYSTEHLGGGEQYVTYRLEYDIYRNNGTYRNDCAPEKESPEFYVLRVSGDGSIAVERRVFYRETPVRSPLPLLIVGCYLLAAIVGTVIFVLVRIGKSRAKKSEAASADPKTE